MAAQLPSLSEDGAVAFGTADEFDAGWTNIARGAVPVRPQGRQLRPLEQLEIYLVAPGLTARVALRVEVVHLAAAHALLRLLDPAPPKPSLAAPAPAPAPAARPPAAPAARTGDLDITRLMPDPLSSSPSPAPAKLPSTAVPSRIEPLALEPVERSDEFPALTPKPAPSAATAAAPAPLSWSAAIDAPPAAPLPPSPAPVTPASAQQQTPSPAATTSLPPYFTGDALKFSGVDDLRGARQHLTGVGAVLAICDGKVPLNVVEVKLAVGGRETKAKAKVTLAAAAPGTAVVQTVDKGGFKPLLDELDQLLVNRAAQSSVTFPAIVESPMPPLQTPPSMPGVGGGPPRAFSLPRQGSLQNPTSPAAILDLPLARPPTDVELSKPSVPLLLRWLRTTRGTMRLEVTAADHPVFTAVFVDGREVRTPASLATLGKSLALAQMTYNIVELGRPPQMTTTGRTMHLIGEVVRALCTGHPVEELQRAFPPKPNLCARAIPDVVAGLGLPAQHQRFIKTDVDGTQFIEEIAKAAVGGRTVWETLYLLEVYNGISWDEPPEGKKPSRGNTGKVERSNVAPADDEWTVFEGKDHFQVLGLHWSSSPTEVAPAYQKLRSEYGPNGVKRPASVQTADKILKRLEEAYKVLNVGDTRRAYRREKYNLVWAHQAQLLVQKAKLALYRKDYQETQNILLAAEDLHPSEEAKALLAVLKQKTQQS